MPYADVIRDDIGDFAIKNISDKQAKVLANSFSHFVVIFFHKRCWYRGAPSELCSRTIQHERRRFPEEMPNFDAKPLRVVRLLDLRSGHGMVH